jgi:hypothetical protein
MPWCFNNFAQQPYSGNGIAPFLNQHIEDFALVIDGAPEPHPLAGDLHDHFVQMPAAGRLGSGPS